MEGAWIELEYEVGRARYTYWPEVGMCVTLIKWEWKSDSLWEREKRSFFDRYPNVPIRTRSGLPIDIVNDCVFKEGTTP